MNRITYPLARSCNVVLSGVALLFVVVSKPLMAQNNSRSASEIDTLKKLSFEDLLNVEVTLVAGRAEKLSGSPSAIQVVTGEDIHRSGASSLPEALRLAMNLQVAQVNSHDWAVTARGFNNTSANKLLVMIDGRSVYTPLYAGVFWQEQNVMLEDIDRIEVVSGPGATLWGANAVNGVINIVTKSAKDTQGTLISGGGGSLLNGFGSFRYGDKIGENLFFRLYGMGFDRGPTRKSTGERGTDDWYLGQGGFRMDWIPGGAGNRTFTLEGNGYGGELNTKSPNITDINSQNLLGRWSQQLSEGSDITVQTYWDRTDRRVPNSYAEKLNTYDLTFQHSLQIGERQRALWGGGYRLMADRIDNINPAALSFLPAKRDLQLFSGFVQDEITLVRDKLTLTLGTKLEHNSYSGFEPQPSGRLAWKMTENQTLWGAVSRAVRSPSRIDADLTAPVVNFAGNSGRLDSNPNFDSEKLLAFELGYRVRPQERIALSLATFYNCYDDLRSLDQIATNIVILDNHFQGETWGVELVADWQANSWWRWRAGYDYFHKHLSPASPIAVPTVREGNDPHHVFKLQSIMTFSGLFKDKDRFQFDVTGRYCDALPDPNVPSYISCDVRLAWAWKDRLEIAVVGQNLLDNQHPEFGALATRQEIPRSVFGKVTLKF